MITITTEKAKYPKNLADEYLLLKSRQAELAKEEGDLKRRLIGTGLPVIEGNFARVTVSEIGSGTVIDWQAAFFDLVPKTRRDKADNYTKFRQGGYRFNVRARTQGGKV